MADERRRTGLEVPEAGSALRPATRSASASEAQAITAGARRSVPVSRLRALAEAQLESEADPLRRARLSYELGRVFERELGEPRRAAEHYLAALRHAPDHVAALRAARRTLAACGDHAALPALFDAEISVTRDPSARARLLYTKALVLELRLGELGAALAVQREALAIDRGNLRVLKAIERGLRRDEAWAELAEVYLALASAVRDPALRAAWTSMAAHLAETRLGDAARASALYESAVAIDPLATPALAHLKRLSASHARWHTLVAALRKEHELTADEATRHSILGAIAHIEERRLGALDAATATVEEALRARPGDRALLADLVRLGEAQGQSPVVALARLAEVTRAPDELAVLCHRLGRAFELELHDLDRARPWYERALATDATHRAAAHALARIYEEREEWTELLRVLSTRAAAIHHASEQADLFHRIGGLLESRLGQRDAAANEHARALGLDPDHHAAFLALARLHAVAERWHDLAELYERAVDRAAHDGEAITWLFRLGAVLEDRLGDLAGAIAAYERILARDPASLGALHAIGRAAERAGRMDRVVDALRAEAQLTAEPDRRDALLHRAAVITHEVLGDSAAARAELELILHATPAHAPSLTTLAELAAAAGRWDDLVAIQARLLPLVPPREQVRLHQRAGELLERELGNDAAAIERYRLALLLDPAFEPARDALIAALERMRAYADLAMALEERLARTPAPAERARIATALGTLYEEKLGDRTRAVASHERALEADPLHRTALDARERLLTDAKDVTRLAQALEAEVATQTDEPHRVQASLRAALALVEPMGTAALGAFRPLFTARPDHVAGLLAVEDAYRRAGDAAGLAATYERLAGTLGDPVAKHATLAELASARAASDGDAAAAHREILAIAPDDVAALEELAAMAERTGDHETERAMHARLAGLAHDPTLAAHHQCRTAEILAARGDAPGALAAYRAALSVDPRCIGAAEGLSRAARAAADPAALHDAARYEAVVTRDGPTAVELLLESARLYVRVDREEEAAVCYEEALALAPDEPEAATGLMATMMRSELVPHLVTLLVRAAHAATHPGRVAALHLSSAMLQAELLDDLPAAIASVRRALVAVPRHGAAIGALARYLERGGSWVEAAAMLEQVIERADVPARIDAHVRLAHIAERHLREPARAMQHLRTVLAHDASHAGALTSLVRLERLRGDDEEALRLARTLIGVVTDDVERADAFVELAELERARGQADEAARAAYWAMGVQGPGGPAAKIYRELVERAPEHASWDHYLAALLAYVDRAKAHGGDRSGGYREIARIFTATKHAPERVAAALRDGVVACPLEAGIALALVAALRQSGAEADALAELRRFTSTDAVEVGAWRALAEVLASLGIGDGASVALAPLVAIGKASPDEEKTVRLRPVRPAGAPAAILAEAGLRRLGTRALDESPALFIAALGEIITKLEGIDHERWSVSKRDRIRAGDPHPVRAVADRIGRILGGVPEYDLFTGVTAVARPFILSGSPPALLVPPGLEGLREPVQAFHLARPLVLLARQLHPLDHVDDASMERLLVAAVRQIQPSFVLDPIADEDDLDREVKRVAKAVGFFSRSRLQEAASAFAGSPPASYSHWAREIRRLSARAAMLIADDLLATLEALGEIVGPDNYATDLVRFWVGDPAIRFRRAVAQQSPAT